VAATSKKGSTIHDFEYIKLKDGFNVEGHDAQYASISGVIDAIKPNPNKSLAFVLRIYISNGSVKLKDTGSGVDPASDSAHETRLEREG